MKVLSKIGKVLFWILVLVLLAAPLGLIYEISTREQAQYAAPTAPAFVETAYGAIREAERMDMEDCVLLTGAFRSESYEYVELSQWEPSKIRWNVNVGDEIQEGEVIGIYKGDDVLAEVSGLVAEIHAYSSGDAYIKVQLPEPVLLECDVTPKVLLSLKHGEHLTTEDGEPVTLEYVANIRNTDGTTHVRLAIDSDAYFLNQEVKDFQIRTGSVYMQALVLPEDCVYQKTVGEDEPWYARQVSGNGEFIREVEVTRGFSDGTWVCVSGVEAGDKFDAGYKAIAEGGGRS